MITEIAPIFSGYWPWVIMALIVLIFVGVICAVLDRNPTVTLFTVFVGLLSISQIASYMQPTAEATGKVTHVQVLSGGKSLVTLDDNASIILKGYVTEGADVKVSCKNKDGGLWVCQ